MLRTVPLSPVAVDVLVSPSESSGHASRVDLIVADVSARIRSGGLPPGARLPSERTLCIDYGVGRTTVREALRLLFASGAVLREGRGVVVSPTDLPRLSDAGLQTLATHSSIRDLYEVRKLIESRVARWAAMRASEGEIDELREIVLREGPSADESRQSHATFHDALVRAAHNPVLSQVYSANRELLIRLPFFWQLFPPAAIQETRSHRHEMAHHWHQGIVEALEQQDPEEAESAMFQHLDLMEKDLLVRIGARPD